LEQDVKGEIYADVTEHGHPAYSPQEQVAIEYAERFALDHLAIDETFWARLREHFTDAEIVDLTICAGNWLAFGRLTQVLHLDVVCEI